MLKKILSPECCAECRKCCVFDRYDIWQTPVFDDGARQKILEAKPGTEFFRKDGGWIYNAGRFDEDQLFECPALTKDGCMLGDEKPFDCRIWPYRVMMIGDMRVIAIATICEELYDRPLSQLVGLLKDGLAETIFSYADSHPEMVRPYFDGYPVLMFDKKSLRKI